VIHLIVMARRNNLVKDVLSSGGPGQNDWRRHIPEPRRRRLRLWFWSIAAVTLAIVAIGGITRLTQSGLSIVDWQPLIGAIPPLTESQWIEAFDRYRQFPEYRQLRRGMALDEFKVIFFWEYLHRLVARLIGVVFLVPFLLFWRAGYFSRPLFWRSLGLFALGAAQGVLGWIMVKSGLVDRPSVSHYRLAAHLTLALIILSYAVWLARDLTVRRPPIPLHTRRGVVGGLIMVGVLVATQIVWGAFVAGLRAGLIFNTFPLMGGQLLPPSGLALEPPLLNLVQNMTTVQWLHRLLGTIVLAASVAFYLRVRRITSERGIRRLNLTLVLLIVSQYTLGVLTLLYRVPTSLAVAHQVTAGVIVGVWVAWMHDMTSASEDYPDD
jgi:cytochrome c oxidase assembly protein subunit 15